MNKNQLQNILDISYKDGNLNEEIVLSIADKLNRHELKTYIRELRTRESKNQVIITLPWEAEETDKEIFKKLFMDKRVIFETKQQILVGTRIVNADIIYDFNLEATLKKIVSYVSKYD